MEYKINKIDTDRRKQINDASKEGIIHGYDSISINKNKERKNSLDNKANSQKYKPKKLFVDATKADELEVEVYKDELNVEKNLKGTFLDVKR
jgi:hypothetical protein